MKRAVATITVYISGETNEQLIDEAQKIVEEINAKIYRSASVDKIHVATVDNTGLLGVNEIDLSKIIKNEKI